MIPEHIVRMLIEQNKTPEVRLLSAIAQTSPVVTESRKERRKKNRHGH